MGTGRILVRQESKTVMPRAMLRWTVPGIMMLADL